MRAVLKSLHSPDVDLDTYLSDHSETFGFLIEADIGTPDEKGADIFQFVVCTGNWITPYLKSVGSKSTWGAGYLIVTEYDYASIVEHIEHVLQKCEGPDWETVSMKLSKYMLWEFEDYQTGNNAP